MSKANVTTAEEIYELLSLIEEGVALQQQASPIEREVLTFSVQQYIGRIKRILEEFESYTPKDEEAITQELNWIRKILKKASLLKEKFPEETVFGFVYEKVKNRENFLI